MKRSVLLLPASASLLSCGQATDANPTLCQLAEARENYAGRTVTVEGYLLVSGHGTSVADPRCGYGVGLAWNEDDVARVKDLDAIAIRAGGEPLIVRVKVRGRMEQDEQTGMGAPRTWQLSPAVARVVSVQPLAQEDVRRYLTWLEGPSPEPFRPSR